MFPVVFVDVVVEHREARDGREGGHRSCGGRRDDGAARWTADE
jgi:hypothetical protein